STSSIKQERMLKNRRDEGAQMTAGRDIGRECRVLGDGMLIHHRVLRQIEVDGEIDKDQAPGQQRGAAGRVVIANRDHEARARGINCASSSRRRRLGSSADGSGGSGGRGSPWS